MSAREQLVEYMHKYHTEWVQSAVLQRMVWPNTHPRKGNASPRSVVRRLEELEERKILAVKYDHSGNAMYHFIPEDWRDKYVPTSERVGDRNQIWKTKEKTTV